HAHGPQVARHVLNHAVDGGRVGDVGFGGVAGDGLARQVVSRNCEAARLEDVGRGPADAGGRSGHERHPHTTAPELGEMTSPVRYDAASDATKAMVAAISAAVESRRTGSDSTYAGVRHMSVRRAVSVAPGATELTRTPRGASSSASAFVRPTIAPLAAQ